MATVAIIVGGITITTLGCVYMGVSYAKKASGMGNGASQREIDALQEQVNQVQTEMVALKKEVKRLIKLVKEGIA